MTDFCEDCPERFYKPECDGDFPCPYNVEAYFEEEAK